MEEIKNVRRPAAINKIEISEKLTHLKDVLKDAKKAGIYLTQEGALRWLTGVRHQITDIAANDISPVSALCLVKGNKYELTFITSPFEMPRIQDELPPIFKTNTEVKIKFALTAPKLGATIIKPTDSIYAATVGQICRPLIGDHKGNQFKKYTWVASMQTAAIAKAAYEIEPGMNGTQVRQIMLNNMIDMGLETNMLLVALKKQENHLHPLYNDKYKITANSMLKLVSAGRLGDVIVSATQMVRFGKISRKEATNYAALQQAVVEYADLYRNGANEHDIYLQCGKRFNMVEKDFGIKGFGKSAYLHHLGGPTSPLGNRDYCLDKTCSNTCFSGMSFAINPVDCLTGTKVEVQGIVNTEGAPTMLDYSLYVPEDMLTFSEVTASGGTVAKIANIIQR